MRQSCRGRRDIHVFDQREVAPISVWVLLKNTTPELRTAMGPKEHKQMESEHRKVLEKKGETQQQQQGTQATKAPSPPPTRLELHQQGVCRTVALPFTLKSILRQKEEL